MQNVEGLGLQQFVNAAKGFTRPDGTHRRPGLAELLDPAIIFLQQFHFVPMML